MKLKHKSLLAGVISAAIVLPAATQISFANGNIEESIQGRTADYRTITGNDVNFRKGPGTNYSSIAKLNKGVKVEFLGTQGSWTKLKYNGIEGYVHSNYVSTASTNNSEETVKTTKVVTGSSVNLRKGPGTSYTVIKALSRGTEVGYISESNGWAKVSYNGTVGYMSAKYLGNKSTQAPSDNNQSSTDETVKSTKVVTGSSVNLRKGPGTRYTVIKALSRGTEVGYISESNGWAKVNYNGTIGYMSAKYLGSESTQAPSDNNQSSTEETVKATKVVTGSSVNLRKGPGTSYTVIKALGRGTEVGYISESNGWAKVNYNGTIGYMSASYLGNASDNSNNSTSKPSESNVESVMSYAKKQLGKPYVWGAEGPDSFDCSGFTQYVFKNSVGISIPRVSKDQSKHGQFVSRSELQRGDLVFFDTSGDGAVNHVGIYMGENQFIHASSGGGKVVISEMNSYYSPRYINARRVL